MRPAEVLIGLVLLAGLLLLAISVRRRLLSRDGGAVEVSFRLKPRSQGRGWVLGLGRFVGDELQWFKVFSFSPRPRRTMNRRDLHVQGRRTPAGPEALAVLKGAEILELVSGKEQVEIALDRAAVTGFLAWMESRPPGATMPY